MALKMRFILLIQIYIVIISLLNTEAVDDINRITSSHGSNVEDKQHISNAVNDFGYKMMLTLMQRNLDDNIVISPTSIAGLLAMTLLGSVGNTYQELAKTLGFSQDILVNRHNHEQFGELLKLLNDDRTSKTLYADAMFVDEQAKLRNVFRDYLSRVYGGEALSVDFRQKEEVKQVINEWIKNHTEGQIENFLKQSLPESTKAVLLSALYFSGQWKHIFYPEYTMKMPFKTPNDSIMADLMLNMGEFDYILSEKEGLHMIALHYNDSATTLYALKPRISKNLQLLELMQRLDYNKIEDLINQMMKRKAVIRFPKMELQTTTKLEEVLKDLGIKSMFHPTDANFALMIDGDINLNKTEKESQTEDDLINKTSSEQMEANYVKEILNNLPNPGVYVDSIIHDVKLTINEYGTEAVAATSGILARSAELFYADSPFYMFIRNEKTKLITFSAAIFDPTK